MELVYVAPVYNGKKTVKSVVVSNFVFLYSPWQKNLLCATENSVTHRDFRTLKRFVLDNSGGLLKYYIFKKVAIFSYSSVVALSPP